MPSPTSTKRPGLLPFPVLLPLAVPALVILLFLVLPLGVLLLGTPPSLLLETLRDPEVRASFVLTMGSALTATALGLLFGVPLAFLLARRSFRGRAFVEGLIDLPVVIPHTAAGIALLFVFGRKALIGEPLHQSLGVELTGNVAGIVLAMTFVSVPYLIRAARDAFRAIDPRVERVARTLGASPWQVFWRVSLPLAWRGITTGMVLMWARGVSEFGAVVIVAYNPMTAPVLVWDRFEKYGLAYARPVAALILICSLVLFAIVQFIASAISQPHEDQR